MARSTRPRRRSTAVSSRRKASDNTKFSDNWERIFGNKDENSVSDHRDSGDGSAEDLCDEADPEGVAGRK